MIGIIISKFLTKLHTLKYKIFSKGIVLGLNTEVYYKSHIINKVQWGGGKSW